MTSLLCRDLPDLNNWDESKFKTVFRAYLNKCKLTSLDLLPVQHLTKLSYLNLSDNKFILFPQKITQLINLMHLDMNSNLITNLPETIGNLVNLKFLSFYNNKIISLPESIGNLTQLQSLILTSNYLETLPESIGNLTQLKRLELNVNNLNTLPESIGNLTQLNSLNIFDNPFNYLPNSILQLRNVQIFSSEDYQSLIHKDENITEEDINENATLLVSDIIIDTSQMGMDVIEGEVRISDFLKENSSNLVIKSMGTNNFILTSQETIKQVMKDAIFYKCKNASGSIDKKNIEKSMPLFQFNSIGLNIGFGFLSEINALLKSSHQYYAIQISEKNIQAVVSKTILTSRHPNFVSANHCQPLQSGEKTQPIYHIVIASAETTQEPKKTERKSKRKKLESDQIINKRRKGGTKKTTRQYRAMRKRKKSLKLY